MDVETLDAKRKMLKEVVDSGESENFFFSVFELLNSKTGHI